MFADLTISGRYFFQPQLQPSCIFSTITLLLLRIKSAPGSGVPGTVRQRWHHHVGQPDQTAVFLTTLGCKVNQYDTAAMQERLARSGCRIVAEAAAAQVCIVNTCVVTARTEAQSRQCIRRLLRCNPGAVVLVTGCYAQLAPDTVRALSERVHVAGNVEKDDIARVLRQVCAGTGQVCSVSDTLGRHGFTSPPISRFLDRTRAFLKIQDGCNGRCTYCIVPTVRGPSRSLPETDVRHRLAHLAAQGYHEIVLTGIHLGAWGQDLPGQPELYRLLDSLDGDGAPRLRISSLEPNEITVPLLQCIAASRRICPHLHIPLQSGDDTVLEHMNRPYRTAAFRNVVMDVSARIPRACIGVDVIVGFPGETGAQFENTVTFLQALPISYLHVFPYSRRPGTPAAVSAGQVHEAEKKRRVRVLRGLSDELKKRYFSQFRGQVLSVLPETGQSASRQLRGVSRNYIPVEFQGPVSLRGREVRVRIDSLGDGIARGTLQPGAGGAG